MIVNRQMEGKSNNVVRRPSLRMIADVPKKDSKKLNVFVACPNNPIKAVKASDASVDIPTAVFVAESQHARPGSQGNSSAKYSRASTFIV